MGVLNCLWLPVFSYKLYWLAFLLMLLMDVSLIMIYRIMKINYGAIDRAQDADMLLPSVVLEDDAGTQDRLNGSENKSGMMLHPWPVKLLCFVGFSTNISWLTVASVVNFLVATGGHVGTWWSEPSARVQRTQWLPRGSNEQSDSGLGCGHDCCCINRRRDWVSKDHCRDHRVLAQS